VDITPEMALEHLERWKRSSAPLSVAVGNNGLKMFSGAKVEGLSRELLYLRFPENGGLMLPLSRAKQFRTFLPGDEAPSDVGITNKSCVLLLVITLEDRTLCKICETLNPADFRLTLFSDADKVDQEQGSGFTQGLIDFG
jgi:hypothetical protein